MEFRAFGPCGAARFHTVPSHRRLFRFDRQNVGAKPGSGASAKGFLRSERAFTACVMLIVTGFCLVIYRRHVTEIGLLARTARITGEQTKNETIDGMTEIFPGRSQLRGHEEKISDTTQGFGLLTVEQVKAPGSAW